MSLGNNVKKTDPVTELVEEADQRFKRSDRYDRIKPVDPVYHWPGLDWSNPVNPPPIRN